MEKTIIIYVHGKGGSAREAEHYRELFPGHAVAGLDYRSATPWEAREEFSEKIEQLSKGYEKKILVANSIGAYFSMNALENTAMAEKVKQAYFISPIVDMEKLIKDMMLWANVTETELQEKQTIETSFGETLSWEYLSYVRENPFVWNVPTAILYGGQDNLTSKETITEFAKTHNADLTIMEAGEHWFHTAEQMEFLDSWIKNSNCRD